MALDLASYDLQVEREGFKDNFEFFTWVNGRWTAGSGEYK